MIVATSTVSGKVVSPVALAADLESYVRQAAEQGRPLQEVERRVFETVLEIGHAAVDQFLQAQGDGDLGASVTSEHGQVLQRSKQPVDRKLRTVFGLHTIQAYVYAPGLKEKIALRPIDARLELSDRQASYLFEEFSQYFCVEQAFGPSSEAIQTVLGQQVPVDTLERINRRLGDQADGFLDALPRPLAEQEGELLVLTADGKGVPLVKKDAASVAAFEEAPQRPGNRRMAMLAGVYSVDRHVRTAEQVVAALFRDGAAEPRVDRPKPQNKHIRGCFTQVDEINDEESITVSGTIRAFAWAEQQVSERLRAEQPLVCLIDGQRSLWEAAELCLASVPRKQTVEILDILHVSQYVWRAAKVFHRSFEHREAFARDRLLRILQGGVKGVIAGFRQMATRQRLSKSDRREIDTVCGYFSNNVERMDYDEYLREGYPIATGVIEGACRHFVKDRMERSGMRWCLDGAQSMLNVRAVFLSSYWDDFQKWRIQSEQERLHPNRTLLQDYESTPLHA